MKRFFGCLGMAAAMLLPLSSNGVAAEPNFAGKTVRVIVAYAAGGAVDAWARVITNHLARRLPGEPTLIVQNMPGAGGARAANYVYTVAERDGTALLATIAPFTNQYIGEGNVRYEAEKFVWVGAKNISQVNHAHKSLGVRSARDLVTTKEQVIIGGFNPGAARDLRMRSFLESIGITNYRYVRGYQGTGPIRHALVRGEVNYSDEGVTAVAQFFRTEIEAGDVIPLVQSGRTKGDRRVPDPLMPNVPLADELAVELKGEAVRQSLPFRGMNMVASMVALGRALMLPPEVDADVARAFRRAFAALQTDPAFQNDARKITGGTDMELIDGDTAQKFAEDVVELVRTDPQALAYLNDLAARAD